MSLTITSIWIGVLLFIGLKLYYVTSLYNIIAGAVIGRAISWVFDKDEIKVDRKEFRFIGLCAVCCFAAYLMQNVMLHGRIAEEMDFGDFLALRAAEEPFIKGIRSGSFWNIVVWLAEGVMSTYAAIGVFQATSSEKKSLATKRTILACRK